MLIFGRDGGCSVRQDDALLLDDLPPVRATTLW